jgi:hypothetical protein
MGRFFVFLITLVDLLAAGWTYMCGALIVPNVLNLALWLADNLGRFFFYLLAWGWLPHLPIFPLPLNLTQMVAARNQSWGLLWLSFYLLTRLFFLWKSPLMQKTAPAHRVYPQETRWILIEQCVQQYQQALTRFLIPPVTLKVPPTFAYEDRSASVLITWQRNTPILPTFLLKPQKPWLLATFLALELAKYNSTDRFVQSWRSTYPWMRPNGFLSCLGIFFWLPVALLHSGLYKDWCKERVLAYDEFAYLCGQGDALLRFLRVQEANGVQMFTTDYEPSTMERIGHLEALLRDEYAQMAKLGLAVPALPEPLLQPEEKLLPLLTEYARGTVTGPKALVRTERKHTFQ